MIRKVTRLVGSIINKVAQASVKEINDGRTSSVRMKELCRKAAAESCVLLKNEGVLPLCGENISIFGRCQINYFYVGYGSGGDVKAPYKISLLQGLLDNRISVNEQLVTDYRKWVKKHEPYDGFWGHWPRCYDEMPLSYKKIKSYSQNSETAVIVVGRSAGEDRENVLKRGGWFLTKTEENLIKNVTNCFKKVCVVINIGSLMDMSWVEKYKVGAVLYAWQGGQESGNGVADVLSGKVNPCGKLSDTIADINYYTSTQNFGNKQVTEYSDDIYVGYRAFETFETLKDKVKYPFGFGLSYTKFAIEIDEILYTDKITIKVTVTNRGNHEGREVVQVYLGAPNAKLAKPAKVLAAYAKTKLLEPEQSEQLTISFRPEEFASYDDTGVTGPKNCFILEGGEYNVYIGTDVRSAKLSAKFTFEEKVISKTVAACSPDESFTRIVNDNGAMRMQTVRAEKSTLRERVLENMPQELTLNDKVYNFSQVISGEISLDEFIASLSVEDLETLSRGSLDGMYSPQGAAGNAGVFGGTSESLKKKGVPVICTNDGPSGVRLQAHSSLIPIGTALACTFDDELVQALAYEMGREVIERNSRVLLAPGMNIHRNPLCGRNFEYFSEDPYLSGKMAAAFVKGVQSAGASAVLKHFACNNQETNRLRNNSRVSQRALREIYLKNFEICVKEAKPDFIMVSYNKLNGVYNCYNYDLCTEVLRNEWKYEGCVLTDWWIIDDKSPHFENVTLQAYRVRAQVDVFMPGCAKFGKYKHKCDGTLLNSFKQGGITLGEMQRTAKNVLQLCINMERNKKC